MAKLDIITLPDPLLRRTSAPVERVDDELRRFMDDMLETMYEAPGIGLAAVQVGVLRRVLVMDASGEDEDPAPLCMVNPKIISKGDEMRCHEEGCLSIPDYYAELERPNSCRVSYIDSDGKACEIACEGLQSTVVQHEIDHLDAVLFIDYLSKLRRDRVVKKFIKAHKNRVVA